MNLTRFWSPTEKLEIRTIWGNEKAPIYTSPHESITVTIVCQHLEILAYSLDVAKCPRSELTLRNPEIYIQVLPLTTQFSMPQSYVF